MRALQKDIDKWLKCYNGGRPNQGNCKIGRRTLETVNFFTHTGAVEG